MGVNETGNRPTPQASIILGTRESDVLAGRAAQVKHFLYNGGDLFEFTRNTILLPSVYQLVSKIQTGGSLS